MSIVAVDTVPLVPGDDPLAFEVAFIDGGTYRLEGTSGKWTMTSPADTDARFIIRGDSVTLVVPQREVGAADRYVLSTESGVERFSQPETPIVGVLSMPEIPLVDEQPPTTDSIATAETPESFFAALTDSLSSGDTSFAFDRLHPLVIDTFGADVQCRAHVAGRRDLCHRCGRRRGDRAVGMDAPRRP